VKFGQCERLKVKYVENKALYCITVYLNLGRFWSRPDFVLDKLLNQCSLSVS